MAREFIYSDKSFIVVCNVKVNERKYFSDWIDSFAEQVALPPMAFGGYGVQKLDHGVLILYLLQPEWWDYFEYRKKYEKGETEYVSEDWKSQDHIQREQDEAIAAFYDRPKDKFLPNKDIAELVGVGDKTV